MASGIEVSPECLQAYEKLKMSKTSRYIVYCMSPNLKQIIVHKCAEKDATYKDLCDDLKDAEGKKECRYVVFDAPYRKGDSDKSKILMFFFAPDNATVKQKMVYSSSQNTFKAALGTGISAVIQASDDDDLQWKNIEAKLLDLDRYS